jgi:hypothetical protein
MNRSDQLCPPESMRTFLPGDLLTLSQNDTNIRIKKQYLCLESALQAGMPVVLIGEPGTAKTATIHQSFDDVYVLYGSSINPEDVHGIVVLDEQGQSMERKPMSWLTEMNRLAAETDPETGLPRYRLGIFIDEMNHLDEIGQRAVMRIFNERQIGDVRIHPQIRLIGAMNDYTQAGGFAFNSALANRFKTVEWKADTDRWLNWIAPLSEAHNIAVSYFNVNRAAIQAFPESEEARSGKWPSMRSWTNALYDYQKLCDMYGVSPSFKKSLQVVEPFTETVTQVAKTQKEKKTKSGKTRTETKTESTELRFGFDSIIVDTLAGYVGISAAMEFVTYLDNLDLIDPVELLANPKLYVPSDRPDVNYAQLRLVANHIKTGVPNAAVWRQGMDFMIYAAKVGAKDIAANAIQPLLALLKVPEWRVLNLPIPTELHSAFSELLKL